jgi:Zn finger protein HypA/HybF involved in hydrogenase expression
MHEVGLVQDIITQAAAAAGQRTIRQVHIVREGMCDVTREALAFWFDQLREGTPFTVGRSQVDRP